MPHPPELSVVVAMRDGGQTVRECLTRLVQQAEGRRVQIIVVDGSTGGSATLVLAFPQVTRVTVDPDWLVPRLWSRGIQEAAAPIVALTIGQCIPDANWIASILRTAALHDTCAGFGGSIDGPHQGRWRDWAVYFSRYSAYMPPVENELTAEIAGDNAAYRMAALDVCENARSAFWENLVHHDLRARGWTLRLATDMRVQLGPCPSAWRFCLERYRHGRYFASTRPGTAFPARLIRLMTAPALPPFLILRIGRRIASHRRGWLLEYLLAMPWLVIFMTSWSLGEAAGYLKPQPETP